MSRTESTMLDLGTTAPDFALLDVISGNIVHRDDFRGKQALLVIFICAHCPYVKHIEKSLGELGHDYAGQPLAIVAISSNDAVNFPADNPEGLRQQAHAQGFNFPYLFDETQAVAKAYQAACTPDIYLFDSEFRLVYRGQYDSTRPKTEAVATGEDLRRGLDLVLAGKPIPTDQRPSLGCNIKWKE